MRRLTAAVLAGAAVLALACQGASSRWTVTVNGDGTPERVEVERVINGTTIRDTVRLPKTWTYGAGTDVMVSVSTPSGAVGCLITRSDTGAAVAADTDPDRQRAQCAVERRAAQ